VVHPQLEPLVRQQLDTFEHQRIAWHGPLWPDQQAAIVITGEPQTAETQATRAWRVQLELHTPTLGKVSADIALNGRRLNLRVNGESTGLSALREGRAALEHALSAYDLDVNPIHITDAAP
jgi:Flagellar hook-length control protein FliK